MTATEFDFTTRPATAQSEVDQLIEQLRGDGWQTAKQIKANYGHNDRKLRDLKEHADGRIISGQQGYMLTIESTTAEAFRAADRIASQARKMHAGARAIRAEAMRNNIRYEITY
tara:strand:- start:5887 stop:6228 length:342 start_codon:yes stop_codon:yes gene_type:complete